jgi:hypothetical protein
MRQNTSVKFRFNHFSFFDRFTQSHLFEQIAKYNRHAKISSLQPLQTSNPQVSQDGEGRGSNNSGPVISSTAPDLTDMLQHLLETDLQQTIPRPGHSRHEGQNDRPRKTNCQYV